MAVLTYIDCWKDDLKRIASNVKAKRAWYSNLETVNIAAISGEKTKKDAGPKKIKK